MYKCFIKLVICGIELSTGIVHVLSMAEDKLELPIEEIEANIDEILSKLFEKNVNLGSSWASIKLIKPVVDNENIYLYYMTKIPFDTQINGFWFKSTTCCAIDNNLQECIKYV